MKNIKHFILSLLVVCALGTSATAQVDSRNRTAETVIIDGLAQLPTSNPKKFNQLMSEFAGTGQKGVEILASSLKPAAPGVKNASYEYAISGLVDWVSDPANSKFRQGVHDGLLSSLEKCTDNANRAYLLTQVYRVATKADLNVYKKYLKDDYLQNYAVRGIAYCPGIDAEVVEMMKSVAAPKADLAYIAYYKKLQGVEDILLSWLPAEDDKTAGAIYNALTVCGGTKAAAYLGAEAKKLNYAYSTNNVTDDYLMLLNNLDDAKTVAAGAKLLQKNSNPAVRCAGMKLALKAAGSNGAAQVLAALKDGNKQYRNTALLYGLQYCGDGLIATVAQKFNGLKDDAKADVVSWFGNNKSKENINLVAACVGSKNPTLAKAAIDAAGRIGGDKALEALIGQLSGVNADAATAALKAFNGSINNGVVNALSSTDASLVSKALALVSERRIASAYDKVVSLTKSDNGSIKDAAYDALKGVVRPNNFTNICTMMESASGAEAAKSQAAAKNAIQSLSPAEQFTQIEARLKSTSKAASYYPLLAQAGNSDAIKTLMQEYGKSSQKDAALNALLQVNNEEMVDILYNLAKENPAKKDAILGRYLTLARNSQNTAIRKYQLYAQALELNPGDAVKKNLVSALGSTLTLPALTYLESYLNDNATAFAAAEAVKTIISKNSAIQAGAKVKAILTKAKEVYAAQTNNADAGYAVKEIEELLPKLAANGFAAVTPNATKAETAAAQTVENGKSFENFEIYADFKAAAGNTTLVLRGMDQIVVNNKTLDVLVAEKKSAPCVKDWNTVYISMKNDRVSVTLNGNKIVENAIISNGEKAVNYTGAIALAGEAIQVRNVLINELPSTPIFKLSAEEEKQGFEVLFDGRSLEKWHGNTTSYVPNEGCIYVSANYGGTGNLYTKKNYSDFIFRFEFWFDVPAVNNGIGIRTGKDVTGVDAAYDGMEIQVLDHDDPVYQGHPFGYKGLRPYQNHGSVYGIVIPEHVDFGPIKQWHTEEIKAVGDRITVTVDGKVITDVNIREACQGHNVAPDGSAKNPYTLDHKNHPGLFNKEGYISFCGHGAGVKFRNVRVLDLSKPASKAKSKKNKK